MYEFKREVEVEDRDNDRSGKCMIAWGVELEIREWGIKSLIVSVPDQEFKGYLTADNYEDIETNFMIKDVAFEGSITGTGCLCPETLVIEKGKFTLEF